MPKEFSPILPIVNSTNLLTHPPSALASRWHKVSLVGFWFAPFFELAWNKKLCCRQRPGCAVWMPRISTVGTGCSPGARRGMNCLIGKNLSPRTLWRQVAQEWFIGRAPMLCGHWSAFGCGMNCHCWPQMTRRTSNCLFRLSMTTVDGMTWMSCLMKEGRNHQNHGMKQTNNSWHLVSVWSRWAHCGRFTEVQKPELQKQMWKSEL